MSEPGDARRALLPGATIGILGGGQLGRMLAIAARRLGCAVAVLDPDPRAPAAAVADRHVIAAYGDLDAASALAASVDVVTFEFENVPAEVLAALEARVPVRPSARSLKTCRHRGREKDFLASLGLPLAPYRRVESAAEALAAARELGAPAVLKTAEEGYDGKGQRRISAPEEAPAAFAALGARPAVLEAFVRFEAELSLVAARSLDGEVRAYPLLRNTHANHVLDLTTSPAGVDGRLEARAAEFATSVLTALDHVGVLCVELFLVEGDLWVNELAPRVHNSGHGTLEAAVTDQFEQHLRAVLGLPLGDSSLVSPFAMANLLGDLWSAGEPNWRGALAEPGVRLHLYGKGEPRPGRKMGHLTALGASPEAAGDAVRRARAALGR